MYEVDQNWFERNPRKTLITVVFEAVIVEDWRLQPEQEIY